MIHLLFVDDEPNILQGLQRMLRPMRQEWRMSFASCGPDALELLGRESCDIVVSDMRMPGMSGAQLLAEIGRRYPRTVRIVLSGQSDREDYLQVIDSIHQYLSKPCDAEMLKETIRRALDEHGESADFREGEQP